MLFPPLLVLIWLHVFFDVSAGYNITTHGEKWRPHQILRVTAQNVTLNCQSRYSTIINGTVPGPPVRLREGKTSWIRVFNDMQDQNLTMHWHGLSLMTAPFSDGSPQASQWPIPPGHYFDYEVRPDDGTAGTYFYHSHVGLQANTAAGPLLVDEKDNPPFDYDHEHTIFLTDYWNKTDQTMEKGLIANPFTWEGEVNNVLVNGKGRPYNSTASHKKGCELAAINVEPGKTYRLRFIAATGLSFLTIALEGHKEFTIIEADGAYTKPYEVNFLQIASGQRYSVLLHTKSEEELEKDNKSRNSSSYFLQMETRERPTKWTAYAVLQYAQKSTPTTLDPPTKSVLSLPSTVPGWLDYDLSPFKPDHSLPSFLEVTRRITLVVNQTTNSTLTDQALKWSVNNNTPWYENTPKKPYLVALYENDQSALPNYDLAIANGGFDPNARAFVAKAGEILDIVIQAIGLNTTGDVHPFHLHGAHFWDLGSGNGTYNVSAHGAALSAAMKKGWYPLKRDTSMLFRPPPYPDGHFVPKGVGSNWRSWRLRIDDPGVWMLHCHTLAHMKMGMQAVMVMGDRDDVAPLPRALVSEYLTFGGGAYGNATRDAEVLEYFSDD